MVSDSNDEIQVKVPVVGAVTVDCVDETCHSCCIAKVIVQTDCDHPWHVHSSQCRIVDIRQPGGRCQVTDLIDLHMWNLLLLL